MSASPSTTVSFRIRPLGGEQLQRARACVVGDSSAHPELVRPIVAAGGEPLRCCLRDAEPGERLILFHYRPPLPAPSPYRESGAVYAHADGSVCAPTGPTDGYPEAWRGRAQVLRAYDERGFIHPATRVHDGTDPEQADRRRARPAGRGRGAQPQRGLRVLHVRHRAWWEPNGSLIP